jgi:hypothetical protein
MLYEFSWVRFAGWSLSSVLPDGCSMRAGETLLDCLYAGSTVEFSGEPFGSAPQIAAATGP